SQGGYGSYSPGPSYSGPSSGPSMPSYPTVGRSASNSGSYFPQVTPAPPPPPPSQPYHPPPPQQAPHPNSIPAPGQASNFDLYNKPFGGVGPMAHSEPDRIEPMANLGASAMNTRFENTSTPPPRDIHEPIQVSRGSAGNFSPVEASQPFFPVTVDPPSRATTAGDPFSDSKRVVVEDLHELSEVGSGSAADISGSTASGDLLVHLEASREIAEEHHRDDDVRSIDSDDRMLRIDHSKDLAESPQSGISLLPRVEGEGVVMTDSMGSSGLVHVEKPAQ
ncbi:hypothetical protein FS837_006215, partial [Tulasnella sp. UAMH 9824]